jgi:hypothetical protein
LPHDFLFNLRQRLIPVENRVNSTEIVRHIRGPAHVVMACQTKGSKIWKPELPMSAKNTNSSGIGIQNAVVRILEPQATV